MRKYVRGDVAWYARSNNLTTPDFVFTGQSSGEFYVRHLDGIGLKIEAFGDGCSLLANEYIDLVLWLAEHVGSTGDELEEWLLTNNVEDITVR